MGQFDSKNFNGEVFKKFLLDAEGGNYHLIFNNWNNGKQLPDYDIVANRDYFFTITASSVSEHNATVVENIFDAAPRMITRGNVAIYPGAITVYNINGQVVANGNDTISLQHLSRGIYIIQGRSGSNVDTIKVTINS